MKEINFISKPHEPRALLDGRQTQIVRPFSSKLIINDDPNEFIFHGLDDDGRALFETTSSDSITPWIEPIKCPFGEVGDVLVVKEAYYLDWFELGQHGYKSDWTKKAAEYMNKPKFKSGATMPRQAARIFLLVKKMRVVRVQKITMSNDVIANGLTVLSKDGGRNYKYGIAAKDGWPAAENEEGWIWSDWEIQPMEAFKKFYSDSFGEESYDRNDWVWQVDVELLKDYNLKK